MKKLIIFADLDGTIIKHNNGIESPRSILQEDKKCIRAFETNKHTFILCTGRNFKSVEHLFQNEKNFLEKGFFITSNGAQIYDSNKKLIFSNKLEKKTIETICQIFKNTKNKDKLKFEVFDGNKSFEFDAKSIDINLPFLLQKDFINLCIYSKNKNLDDVKEILQNLQSVHATVSQNNWYVDVLAKNTSKASAIFYILKLLDFDKDTCITMSIGDSWNDSSMFAITDYSFTFHTSPEDVKEKASGLVDHFYEAVEQMYRKL